MIKDHPHFEAERPLPKEVRAANVAKKLISRFENLAIDGVFVRTPYSMNWNPTFEKSDLYGYLPKTGKRSPEEIIEDTNLLLGQLKGSKSENGYTESQNRVLQVMISARYGVDCSGFSYQVCKAVYQELGGTNFDLKVEGRFSNEHGITKTSASDLTDPKNSIQVKSIADVKPGDLIRCFGGKHVISIVEVSSDNLTCAHSSDQIGVLGVHTFPVQIISVNASIFDQVWTERTKNGQNYGLYMQKNTKVGDGIWRLKVIDNIYNYTPNKN